MIDEILRTYIKILREEGLPLLRVFLFGSSVSGLIEEGSDIDLAIFLDLEVIDGFDEDVRLISLTRKADLRIEPHCFCRTDIEDPDPFVREIISTGLEIPVQMVSSQ